MSTKRETLPKIGHFPKYWGARIFGLTLAFALWTAMALVFPNQLMPFPTETLVLAWGLVEQGVALPNVSATLWRTFWGFSGAMFLGTVVGVLMGINSYTRRFYTPYIIIGLSIPAITWAAVGTLIFGFSLAAPVSATILTTFPYIAINVWKGVENIKSDLITMSKSFNISRKRVLFRLILPSAAPFLFSGFRFGLAISWKVVTIAEIFGASNGVGYQLMQAYQLFKFEEAWAWAVLFILVIFVIEYGIVKPLERRVFEYKRDADFNLIV